MVENELNATIYIDVETMGLNAYTDRLTCIGIIVEVEGEIVKEVAISDEDEVSMLREFFRIYDRYDESIIDTITWNKTFDSDFILVRGWKHNFKNYIPCNPVDLKSEFPKFDFDGEWRKPSLDEAAKFLGIESEKLATGAEAPYMWKYGKIEELKEYCLMDVKIMREIHHKLEVMK